MPRVRLVCLIAFLLAAATSPVRAQTQKSNSQAEAGTRLSPEAAQVARQLGVAPLLERLLAGQGPADSPMNGSPMNGSPMNGSPMNGSSMKTTLESLAARQQITESVLSASLDIDTVNAVIAFEIDQIRSIRSDLQSKRDKAQNIINLASIVTGGALGVANTALQFKPSTANIGNGIGVAGGTASLVLSIVGIHQQRGGQQSLGDSPRMLAAFFGRPSDAPEAIASDYPEKVWAYLNSAPPSQPQMGTRKEQLIAKWRSEGRIQPDGSPKGERKIESLSSSISHARRLNIDELSDRVAMLLDVRATVSLMKRDLSQILLTLSAGNRN